MFEESQRVGAKTEKMEYTFRGFIMNIKGEIWTRHCNVT